MSLSTLIYIPHIILTEKCWVVLGSFRASFWRFLAVFGWVFERVVEQVFLAFFAFLGCFLGGFGRVYLGQVFGGGGLGGF